MNQFLIILSVVPLLGCLAMSVMWAFSMQAAMRITVLSAAVLVLIAMQAFMGYVALISYRTGFHSLPAIGIAAQIAIILFTAKQLRDARDRYAMGIIREVWLHLREPHPIMAIRYEAQLATVVLATFAGLGYAGWAVVDYTGTLDVRQLAVAVIGAVLVACCAWGAIRVCLPPR